MKKFYLLTATLALMALACGNPYMKQGQTLEQSGNINDAQAYYEQAVAHDPDDEAARASLARVKKQQASTITMEAQNAAMVSPQTLATLSRAIAKADQALATDSTFMPAQELKMQLMNRWQIMVAQRDDLVARRNSAVEAKDWDEALSKNKQIWDMDPDNGHVYERDKDKINSLASEYYLARAADQIQDRDFRTAIQSMEIAERYKKSPQTDLLKKKISDRKRAAELLSSANALFRAQQYVDALPLFEEILSMDSTNREAKNALAEIYYTMGDQAFSTGGLMAAADHFQTCLSYVRPYKDTDYKLSEIETRILVICNSKTREYMGMNLPGNALLVAQACQDATQSRAFEETIKTARERLKDSEHWPTYAVLDMTRSSRSRRKATSYTEAQIEVPDKIQALMEKEHGPFMKSRYEVMDNLVEMGVKVEEDIRYWDRARLDRLASVIDARYIITGNILEFDVRSNERTESRSKQYVSHVRKNPNPAYSTWVNQKNAVENCKSQTNSRGVVGGLMGLATGDYNAAATNFATNALTDCGSYDPTPPPQFTEEKVWDTCNYEVKHYTVDGYMTTQYLMYDRDTGKLLFDEKVETAIEKDDDVSAGCSAAGIGNDPLEIPSDEEVAEQLLAQNAQDFFSKMNLSSTDALAQRYLQTVAATQDPYYKRENLAVASLIAPEDLQVKASVKRAYELMRGEMTNADYEAATRSRVPVATAAGSVPGGRKWAIVIGLNRYQDKKIPTLRYAQKDAMGMANVLIRHAGFERENVKMLFGPNAGRAEVLAAINDVSRQSRPEDMVVIYFAGHGGVEPDNTQVDGYAKYLLPYDADLRKSLYASAIGYKEIKGFFNKIQAKRLICLLDACYSGAAGGSDLLDTGARSVMVVPTFMDSLASTGTSRVIISASDGNQPSIELPEKQHGVFTYYLIKGLEGEADLQPADSQVTLTELYQYVSSNVRRESAQKGRYHEPMMKGQTSGGTMVLTTQTPARHTGQAVTSPGNPAPASNPSY